MILARAFLFSILALHLFFIGHYGFKSHPRLTFLDRVVGNLLGGLGLIYGMYSSGEAIYSLINTI